MTVGTDDSMSMSSVTGTARWHDERSAVAREPGLALRGPARIELVSADPAQLSFAGRHSTAAPIFLSPLLLTLASLPWLGPPPVDALRVATSGLCLFAAAGVAAWAWPRRRPLHLTARSYSVPGSRTVQPASVRWILDAEDVANAPRAVYTVTLEAGDGASYRVLQNMDPERLLSQFSQVLRHWPGAVDCRWGLPATAQPWNIEPQSGARSLSEPPERVVAVAPLSHGALVWCTRIVAVLVAIDLVLLVMSASARVAALHPLSLALPLIFEACLVALAVGLGGARSRLRIAGRLRRESSFFGLHSRHGDVRVESVRGVHAVGTPAAEIWHLLVDSADGPLALAVPRDRAQELARATERAIFDARAGDPAPTAPCAGVPALVSQPASSAIAER
jgi:hypothetical protein